MTSLNLLCRGLLAAIGLSGSGLVQAGWTITDLGTLAPAQPLSFSAAHAINELGQVVGVSMNGALVQHAFVWSAGGGMVDLGDLPGGDNDSSASGINNAGTVVGSSGALNTAQGYHAFQWTSGAGMADLGAKPNNGYISFGAGINSAGTIVGASGFGSSFTAYVKSSDGAMTLLSKPSGSSTQANAINDDGVIAGFTQKSNGTTRATLWANGTRTELGDLAGGADYSNGLALNQAGLLVGSSGVAGGGHAFAWTAAGGMVDLGDLPGGSVASAAHGVNDLGDIVGFGSNADNQNRALLWRKGSMLDLSTLAEAQAQGWVFEQALDINNAGAIVGWGWHNGQQRGFVLAPATSPVPEPGSWTLLLVGLTLLAGRARLSAPGRAAPARR